MPNGRENLSAGRFVECTGSVDLAERLSVKGSEGYDFLVSYISHPRCCLDVKNLAQKARELSEGTGELTSTAIIEQLLPPMVIPDIALKSNEWSRLIVGRVSPWIDPDSNDPYVRLLSEKALKEELAYFAHLCLPAVLVSVRSGNTPNLARIVLEKLKTRPNGPFAVWADVPITSPQSTMCAEVEETQTTNSGSGDAIEADDVLPPSDGPALVNGAVQTSDWAASAGTWHWFYQFRRSCNNHRRISLVLELTADLPESNVEIARWKGEPIAAIKFDTHTFLSNRADCPVLSKAHQTLAKEFFRLSVQCIVDGPTLHVRRARPGASADVQQANWSCLYYAYLDNLWKNQPPPAPIDERAPGYQDYLQAPLQPLSDHLESEVYETFESDPVKYRVYAQAFHLAVESKLEQWAPEQTINGANFHTCSELLSESMINCLTPFIHWWICYPQRRTPFSKQIRKNISVTSTLYKAQVVMVLGAGRGPLVSVSYETLKKSEVKFKLYAVEKNPCAVVTLNAKRASQWNNEVDIVHSDMRNFHPEEKADIIVSELLGSFGDNELSPECLDGALHLMKDTCISIPSSYRSYIGPIHSPKLYNEVKTTAEREQESVAGFEKPYVVRILNHFEIARPKLLFRFDHPNFKLTSNDRYQELEFVAIETSEMMGLAGYFYATLFDTIVLSTVPRYETPGLSSWFPILFSLQNPVLVKKGERICVRFWRCGNQQQVWYQWQLVEPIMTGVMNACGNSYAMRLF